MSVMALVEGGIPCCKARCKVPVGGGEKVGVEEKEKEVSSREGGAFCKAR
jgi:hypothetical protein